MSAPSENMPITAATRPKPLLLRHLPYFVGAAIVVALAATVQFDGYIHNILMQATTFAIAVFGLSYRAFPWILYCNCSLPESASVRSMR